MTGQAEAAEPRFTIMGGPSIPWRWLIPHEEQAKRNHRQDLTTLYNRGGLSPYEALKVLDDKPLTDGAGHYPTKEDDRAARDELQRRLDADEVAASMSREAALREDADAALDALKAAHYDLESMMHTTSRRKVEAAIERLTNHASLTSEG